MTRKLKGTTLEEKLLMNSVVNENGCRIWQRSKEKAGYGHMAYDGKTQRVSRLAFELWVEPIKYGLCVCHTCDVRACLEPTHLFQDTHAANSADMIKKGRQGKGEANSQSILCEYDILEMRALYDAGFGRKELARMYDMTPSNIAYIVKRQTWKHLTEESV
jgi:hypothetical protein